VLWIARADKPITVPRPHGTPKIAMAARLYPGTVDLTWVAKDFCQNAVSYELISMGLSLTAKTHTITTRARLPNFRIRPQMIASFDFIVKSEPW
jgi:hypothetical protein